METYKIVFFAFLAGMIVAWWLLRNKLETEKSNRKRLAGTYSERFITFLDKFRYLPADSHFLGKPIDYIVFDGLAETGKVEEVVFVEVKTNSSQLSTRERSLKKAIKAGRVKWEEFRI